MDLAPQLFDEFLVSILNRNRENHIFQKTLETDRRTDISNYRVALLLKSKIIPLDQMVRRFQETMS